MWLAEWTLNKEGVLSAKHLWLGRGGHSAFLVGWAMWLWIPDTQTPCSHLLLLISCSPERALCCPPTPLAKQTVPRIPDPHRHTHKRSCTSLHHSSHQACIHGNDRFYLTNTPDPLSDVSMLKLQGVLSLRMAKMEYVWRHTLLSTSSLSCSSSIMSHQLLLTT